MIESGRRQIGTEGMPRKALEEDALRYPRLTYGKDRSSNSHRSMATTSLP